MNSSISSNNNSTESREEWGRTVTCIILAVCFAVGAPGNLLVMWTIVRHVKQRSHTVLLILHLAIADLLSVITLPLWIYSLAHSWMLGEEACQALVYIIYSCMYTSVFLMTVMSVERLLAVRYPFKMLRWKNNAAMTVILVVVWVFALLLGFPTILTRKIYKSSDGMADCFSLEFKSVALEIFCTCLETLIGFIVPFLTLAICYCQVASRLHKMRRPKQKSTFLICWIVLAFALCWLPYHILNIVTVAQLLSTHPDEVSRLPDTAEFVSGALTFISSSVNPMLYAFAAKNIQGSLRKSSMVKLFQEITIQSTQVKETEPQTPNSNNLDTEECSV